jgi:arylsulfatase
MVTRLDREVGRICKLVEELGLDEQTIFVFTSDNGPTYGRLGGSDSDFFQSTAGLRGLKGSLYEGGVRVPAIVRWKGRLGPGRVSDCLTGFEDWLPTLLELAGLSGTTPQGLDGISFALTLLGGTQPPRPFLYREFPGYGGQQSVRFGDWKAVRQGLTPRADAPPRMHIELYNLAQDPGESRDLSEAHSDLVARLERLMREQHAPSSHFPMPALDQQQ